MKIAFNEDSQKVYNRLPIEIRTAISIVQNRIEAAVLRKYPNAVATSGFRSGCYNRDCGGKPDSLHLWGCARDYTLRSLGDDPCIEGMTVIKSQLCWHVQEK